MLLALLLLLLLLLLLALVLVLLGLQTDKESTCQTPLASTSLPASMQLLPMRETLLWR